MHLSLLLPVEFDVSLHGHVLAEVRELDLDQLLGVERAVPVAARAHRLRQHHTSCENRLQIWYQSEEVRFVTGRLKESESSDSIWKINQSCQIIHC